MDGRVCCAFSYQSWFTSPFPRRRVLAKFVRFQGPKPLEKHISQWRKGPTKILLYSLESLLQKRMEQSAKGSKLLNLLKFRHQIRSSLQYTGLHPDIMKRNESEIVYALTTFIFCSFDCYLIWSRASSPCISKHPEISSSKKIITAVQWTTSFTTCQAWLASSPFDALNSGDFVRSEGQTSLKI